MHSIWCLFSFFHRICVENFILFAFSKNKVCVCLVPNYLLVKHFGFFAILVDWMCFANVNANFFSSFSSIIEKLIYFPSHDCGHSGSNIGCWFPQAITNNTLTEFHFLFFIAFSLVVENEENWRLRKISCKLPLFSLSWPTNQQYSLSMSENVYLNLFVFSSSRRSMNINNSPNTIHRRIMKGLIIHRMVICVLLAIIIVFGMLIVWRIYCLIFSFSPNQRCGTSTIIIVVDVQITTRSVSNRILQWIKAV